MNRRCENCKRKVSKGVKCSECGSVFHWKCAGPLLVNGEDSEDEHRVWTCQACVVAVENGGPDEIGSLTATVKELRTDVNSMKHDIQHLHTRLEEVIKENTSLHAKLQALNKSPGQIKEGRVNITTDTPPEPREVSSNTASSCKVASRISFYESSNNKESEVKKDVPANVDILSPNEANVFPNEEIVVSVHKGSDLFSAPLDHSLAHCVARDMKMSAGIATEFKNKFQRTEELLAQKKNIGEVAYLKEGSRYIFYLISKEKSHHKPSFNDLRKCIHELKLLCDQFKIKNVSIPTIGCGLDNLSWDRVEQALTEVFQYGSTHINVHIPKIIGDSSAVKHSQSVLLIGDSHIRGCRILLQDELPGANVVCLFKPNATAKEILKDIEGDLHSKAWLVRDTVIMACGSNDISTPSDREEKKTILQSIRGAIESAGDAKVIVCNLPYRYDVPSLNQTIFTLNVAMNKFLKDFPKLQIANVSDIPRSCYTRHGLHLNEEGKKLLCGKLIALITDTSRRKKPRGPHISRPSLPLLGTENWRKLGEEQFAERREEEFPALPSTRNRLFENQGHKLVTGEYQRPTKLTPDRQMIPDPVMSTNQQNNQQRREVINRRYQHTGQGQGRYITDPVMSFMQHNNQQIREITGRPFQQEARRSLNVIIDRQNQLKSERDSHVPAKDFHSTSWNKPPPYLHPPRLRRGIEPYQLIRQHQLRRMCSETLV
jgi:O-acetyl-ADP-ribose deacetylase (regulator of RNase III)